MKIKYMFIVVLFGLLGITMSQVFSIYPFAKDVFKVYKSGYFTELDKQFDVIADSFVQIKYSSSPSYAWLYLKRIEKKHNIKIKVYDSNGSLVIMPGRKKVNDDVEVMQNINSLSLEPRSKIENDTYYRILPMENDKKCKFCHKSDINNKLAGIITFKRNFNTKIYYSSERIVIFSILSIFIAILIFYVIKWDPEKNIKELFDKS